MEGRIADIYDVIAGIALIIAGIFLWYGGLGQQDLGRAGRADLDPQHD